MMKIILKEFTLSTYGNTLLDLREKLNQYLIVVIDNLFKLNVLTINIKAKMNKFSLFNLADKWVSKLLV